MNVGVHTTHCCKKCGCKYGDPDCPVENGLVEGIQCERCEQNELELINRIKNMTVGEVAAIFKKIFLN